MNSKNLFHCTSFTLRILLAGFLAFILSALIDTKVSYAIEAAVLGFSSYSFVSLAETLVMRQADQKDQPTNDR